MKYAALKAERKQLLQIISDLNWLVFAHHSHSIMQPEHAACPVCSMRVWKKTIKAVASRLRVAKAISP